MTEIQKQRVLNLISALRGGEYKQGENALRPTEDTYCCLGVACDISGVSEWGLLFDGEEWVYDMASSLLPDSVKDCYGFKLNDGGFLDNDMGSLSSMNDDGKSFAEIADQIQYCLDHPENEMFV